jgi:hypothetical protein
MWGHLFGQPFMVVCVCNDGGRFFLINQRGEELHESFGQLLNL